MGEESVQQRLIRLAETLKAFEMTRDEWKRYKRDHPGADIRNHHIIDSPIKKHRHPDKRNMGVYLHQKEIAKKNYFDKMKRLHPNYQPLLDKGTFQDTLFNGEYSCISAGVNSNDPQDVRRAKNDPMFIKRRTESLRKDLDALGVQYTEITGSYGKEEPSFLISHTINGKAGEVNPSNTILVTGNEYQNSEDIIQKLNKLGEKYNQDSVAHSKQGKMEIHYTTGENKGKRNIGLGTSKLNPKETKDYYSEDRIGDEDYTMWSCEIDWDNLYDNPYMI